MGLRQRFAVAARNAQAEKDQQQPVENGHQEEGDDEDSVKGMARLFAELGEAYTELIATGLSLHCPACGLLCHATLHDAPSS